MKKIRILSIILVIVQISLIFSPTSAFAIETSESVYDKIAVGVSCLENTQCIYGNWGEFEYGKTTTADIVNVLELLYSYEFNSNHIIEIINKSIYYYDSENIMNNDDLSRHLLLNKLSDEFYVHCLLKSQNIDGGFGIDYNYLSDIIDTKLALKALADLGETEAMTNAAMYIASQQNADGGFSYQQGLASNPELTAEIADIFGDCIIKDKLLDYVLKI